MCIAADSLWGPASVFIIVMPRTRSIFKFSNKTLYYFQLSFITSDRYIKVERISICTKWLGELTTQIIILAVFFYTTVIF